jgi:hypothetical protein
MQALEMNDIVDARYLPCKTVKTTDSTPSSVGKRQIMQVALSGPDFKVSRPYRDDASADQHHLLWETAEKIWRLGQRMLHTDVSCPLFYANACPLLRYERLPLVFQTLHTSFAITRCVQADIVPIRLP